MGAQIVDALSELFSETITIERCTGESALGARTYGAASTVACRYRQVIKRVRVETGEERVSTLHVVLKGDVGATTKDRYTLASRFAPSTAEASDASKRQPVPIAVGYAADENGPHHQRVYF